jgi:hypothetical protein
VTILSAGRKDNRCYRFSMDGNKNFLKHDNSDKCIFLYVLVIYVYLIEMSKSLHIIININRLFNFIIILLNMKFQCP